MVKDVLVAARIADGRRLVQGMQRDGVTVTVAGWVRADERNWQLYIAADTAKPTGWGDAFPALGRAYAELRAPTFGLSEVQLVRASDGVTAELLAVRDRGRPGRIAVARVQRIDGRPARRVYVYPRLSPLTPYEVFRAVLELAAGPNRDERLALTLKSGDTITANLVGTSYRFDGGVQSATVTVRESADSEERCIPAAEITAVGLADAAA